MFAFSGANLIELFWCRVATLLLNIAIRLAESFHVTQSSQLDVCILELRSCSCLKYFYEIGSLILSARDMEEVLRIYTDFLLILTTKHLLEDHMAVKTATKCQHESHKAH